MRKLYGVGIAAISFLALGSAGKAEPESNISDCRFEPPQNTVFFPRGDYPLIYKLKGLDKQEAFFSVRIRGDGIGVLHSLRGSELWNKFDPALAKDLLGEPASCQKSDREPNSERFVYNLITTDSIEPEIFHIDMEAQKGGRFTAYRIRGYGISKPEWQKIQ